VLILALETSSLAGSVALLEGEQVLAERQLPADRRSAVTLAPTIDELLKAAKRQPAEVRLVAVTVGPGSFTGLRVGVTTAKTFAYAAGCEVLGVDTLEVIAAQAATVLPSPLGGEGSGVRGESAAAVEIHSILDAQRKELYLARFRSSGDELTLLEPSRIIAVDAWLRSLSPGTVVTGPAMARFLDRLPSGVAAAPAEFREPRASTVGRLALRDYERGRRNDLWKLAPQYLRPSAAEEKVGQVFNLPEDK
jgi:tRNA threonylcarbamoyladenosine biosynthesis protein TsaB